jgi:hypothetical protein
MRRMWRGRHIYRKFHQIDARSHALAYVLVQHAVELARWYRIVIPRVAYPCGYTYRGANPPEFISLVDLSFRD